MSGYSDLAFYESEAERNAVCAELARMLRIVPLTPSPAETPDLPPVDHPLDRASAGDPLYPTEN
jgi:hypothetical protein